MKLTTRMKPSDLPARVSPAEIEIIGVTRVPKFDDEYGKMERVLFRYRGQRGYVSQWHSNEFLADTAIDSEKERRNIIADWVTYNPPPFPA